MSTAAEDLQKQLSDPFPEQDIEWRVQQSGLKKNSQEPWVMVIPYLTNRAVQQRLDDVFGFGNWGNEYKPTPCGKGYLCGIKVKVGDEWVTKWDGAEHTQVEALKGALSNSMKRAAVQLGVGRYLYNLETEFALARLVKSRFDCAGNFISIPVDKKNKKSPRISAEWFAPTLPEWALPSFESDKIVDELNSAESLDQLKAAFKNAYKYANSFSRSDLQDKFTKVKDEVKAKLIKEEHKRNLESSEAVNNWLSMAILNDIHSAANQSVLEQAQKRLMKQLTEKVAGDQHAQLLKRLNTATKKRFEQLSNGVNDHD